MKFFIVLLALVAVALSAPAARYSGYKTYRVTPQDESQMTVLRQFAQDETNFDFWSKGRKVGRPMDVMVSPSAQSNFEKTLSDNSITFSVIIENVEDVIEKETQEQKSARRQLGKISFDQYYRHDDIQAYIQQLAEDYPDLATYSVIGQTYEGRDIGLIKISSGGDKPAVFFEAGVHAREWIAPATALYMINQLVENYDANKDLVDNVDWYIVPVTNPDGYEYTHTSDRFWRKNRSKTQGALCRGADANRNYGYKWGGLGTSNDPCSDIYLGKSAFSEKESSAIRDAGVAVKDQTQLYIALHSYGPYLLYPWGYDNVELPEDWEDLANLAQEASDAIQEADSSIEFEVGNSAGLLYAAAGGSDDWFKGGNGVKYAYTMELPGGGSQGFNPPPSRITPIVTAVWEGLKVFGDAIGRGKK